MKLIVTAHILCLTIITFNTNAMDSTQAQIVYQSKQTRGTTTTYKALLMYGEHQSRHFQCEISHDTATNTYSGQYFNNKYSHSEWYSSSISAQEAQSYYQALVDQKH
jgi:hypothetical protein